MAVIARQAPVISSQSPAAARAGAPGAGSFAFDPEDAVARIEREMQARIGAERYDQWFDRKTLWVISGNRVVINAANAFVANWIRGKFMDQARAAVRSALSRDDLVVRVDVDPAVALAGRDESPAVPAPRPAVRQSPGQIAAASALNARFTMDNLVVGPCNQMAHHAAMEIAGGRFDRYNPLFIHGACGLGKTHLLQAICHAFAQNNPAKKFLYITAEQFTNDFVEALRQRQTEKFRRAMRSCELLVIDDVHFLANKKATQEEFLYTLKQVDGTGRQVVMASDCPPRHQRQLTDALVSRFASGMVARVDSPDLSTRLEILRRRAARMDWPLSDTVLMHVAQAAVSSVREMEGLLAQVHAGMNLLSSGFTPSDQNAAILDEIRARTASRAPISADRILAVVGAFFEVPLEAICGVNREKKPSLARAVAMFLARRHCGMSYPEIGRAVGDKKHPTVIAACQKIEALICSGGLMRYDTAGGLHHQAAAEVISRIEELLRKA